MNRLAMTFGILIALAAWADAQNAPPIASDHLKQYRENQALLVILVDDTVELAGAGEPLTKAMACHRVMTHLSHAMDLAVADQNPPRVAELGDHIVAVVNHALVPSIASGCGKDVDTTSDSYRSLQSLHTLTQTELHKLCISVPQLGTLGASAAVKDTLKQMEEAEAALKAAMTVKK